jgi:hypothetical protein
MESFFLLRDNRESGPYSAKELKAAGLYTTDLLWVEGESTCWRNPTEFAELAECVQEPKQKAAAKSHAASATTVSFASQDAGFVSDYSPITVSTKNSRPQPENEIFSTPSFDELQRKYAERAPRKRRLTQRVNIGASLLGLSTFVIGVMMAAFMIKKAVDNIEKEPLEYATAEAHEITSEQLPQSTTAHAAMSTAGMFSIQVPATVPAVMSKETVAVVKPEQKKETSKPKVILPATDELKKPAADTETSKPVNVPGEANADDVAEVKKPEEKTEKPVAKPELQLGTNKYDVGLFGGISNLELTVTNASSQAVEKAVVEVEYIKSNGKVVGSKTVEVTGIAPGSTRRIAVPDHGRGVSVRYRVLNM